MVTSDKIEFENKMKAADKIKPSLKGIPETLLIPLWARAVEKEKDKPIMIDEKAAELIERIDYDFSKFDKAKLSQIGVSVRTELFDSAVYSFIENHRNSVVVNFGAGLDTRYFRLKAKPSIWYELDLPEAIALRRRLIPEENNYRFIEKSVFDFSWRKEIDSAGKPVLFIAEGLFMYFKERELIPLLRRIADNYTNSEMLFEMLCPLMVGKSSIHDSVSKMNNSEFKWGIKDSKIIETWHKGIKFLEEWNYFDYHKDRWKLFGTIARLPLIRPLLSNRLVHLSF